MTAVINSVIGGLATLGDVIIWLLPTSPFTGIENQLDSTLLGYVNYYIPIKEMLDIGLGWVTAIGLWYLYSIILRWVKAIQ